MQGGAGRCVSLPQVRQMIVIRCRSVQNPRARAMAAWTFELIDSAAPLDRPKLGAVEDPRPDGRGRGRGRVSTDQEGRDRAGSGRRTRPPLGRPRRRARHPPQWPQRQDGATEDAFGRLRHPVAFQRKSTLARWPAPCIQYPLWTLHRQGNCLAAAEQPQRFDQSPSAPRPTKG